MMSHPLSDGRAFDNHPGERLPAQPPRPRTAWVPVAYMNCSRQENHIAQYQTRGAAISAAAEWYKRELGRSASWHQLDALEIEI